MYILLKFYRVNPVSMYETKTHNLSTSNGTRCRVFASHFQVHRTSCYREHVFHIIISTVSPMNFRQEVDNNRVIYTQWNSV